ncbi:MAG: hypothetical protein AAFO94_13650, partial [Bacteroidota bacterium]
MKSIRYFLLILIGSLTIALHAQSADSEGQLALRAQQRTNTILLRWAPSNYAVWQQGNKLGYRIDRYPVARDGQLLPEAERLRATRLTAEPIRPMPKDAWAAFMQESDAAAIAAQALFGTNFEVVEDGAKLQMGEVIAANRDNANRFGFAMFAADQSVEVAAALGLYLEDKTADPEVLYRYVVQLANENDNNILPGEFVISLAEPLQMEKPTFVQVEFADRMAVISWEKPIGGDYSSYDIERAPAGSENFTKVNSQPIFAAKATNKFERRQSYADSLSANGQIYQYRLRGKNVFGTYGPYSDVVQGMGVEPIITDRPYIEATKEVKKSVHVSWNFPKSLNNKITGFDILRADRLDGQYIKQNEQLR